MNRGAWTVGLAGTFLALLVASGIAQAGPQERTILVGTAEHANGLSAEIALEFTPDGQGGGTARVDIPMLQMKQVPITEVRCDGKRFSGELGARGARIHGEFQDHAERFVGTLEQGKLSFRLNLARDMSYAYTAVRRPQTPKPPFPYRSRDLVVPHPSGHVLAGTLTIPDADPFGPGPYPAAVLISGGGQENRDSAALGHKPFLVIADYLTRRGIAVMRFDDRGVGGSTVGDPTPVGKNATSEILATDAAAVARHIRDLPEIDASRVGLIGHSEGGLIAPLVASNDPDTAFIVLLAGPGAPVAEVFRKQFELAWMHGSENPEGVAKVLTLFASYQQLLAGATDDPDSEERQTQIRAAASRLATEVIAAGLFEDAGSTSERHATAERFFLDFDTPWWRFAFSYDPAPALAGTRCPVLALNGTKDLQVWHEQNLGAIEGAIQEAKRDVTVIRYEGLNHLFQPATTGRSDEYATIEITIDERVLEDVTSWILDSSERESRSSVPGDR